MLSLTSILLAALAGTALAKPITVIERAESAEERLYVTAEELDLLDLYAEYAGAAGCNFNTTAGSPIACERICDRVEADKGYVVESFRTPITDLAGYVAVVDSRKEIILAARGTVSLVNWLVNIDAVHVPSALAPGATVHKGFYNGWLELAPMIRRAIFTAKLVHPDYKLVIVGHSLGGALATMAAAHLRAIDGYEADLYTYGQPRTGNLAFVDFVSNQPGRLYRVTHNGDPVPHLPFISWGYAHTYPEYWLTGVPEDPNHWPAKDVKVCLGAIDFGCASSLLVPPKVNDHFEYFGIISCREDKKDSIDKGEIPKELAAEIEKEAQLDTLLAIGR